MNQTAQIGPSIHIKGEVTANEPLTIAGQVDGTIDVPGHALTVTADGRVTATVTADTIIVAGSVNGLLEAVARIIVRETGIVEGDLNAPTISLADGATLHGRVETATKAEKRPTALPLAS